MSSRLNHSYHLVDYSPWPLTGALGAMITASGLVKWFHQCTMDLFIIGIIVTLLTMI